MPSSTSSSEKAAMKQDYGRPLPSGSLVKAAIIGALVALLLTTLWEGYWRDFGATPSYRNSNGLWAIQRHRIDQGEGDTMVILGSSRALFNTQLDVWEQQSGERPIQLALEGTSPLFALEDLADDADFSGDVLVGVAPGLFFSGFEYRKGVLKHYQDNSPAKNLSQRISMLIEPYLAFYDPDFALFMILDRHNWAPREGVTWFPEVRKLNNMAKDRNTRMWSKVETDKSYADLAKSIWAAGFKPIDEEKEEDRDRRLESRQKQIDRAVAAVDKLRNKGSEVYFIRNPAEGHYAISEPMYHPRSETWDVLIEKTGAIGIHWQDHEELQGYWLPEWSHLSAAEADRYTAALYQVVQRERARSENQE